MLLALSTALPCVFLHDVILTNPLSNMNSVSYLVAHSSTNNQSLAD